MALTVAADSACGPFVLGPGGITASGGRHGARPSHPAPHPAYMLSCGRGAVIQQQVRLYLRTHEQQHPGDQGSRCASVNGFSLHANTEIPAHRRDQLERLMRYTARGAVSLEWLAEDANGDLIYSFHRPWSDGTTGITLSPLELLEKLSAFVPLPTCPPRPLCGVSGATQHVSRCDHPHTAANRVWTARKRRREHLIGTGLGYWGVSLTWLWPRVPCADVVHSGSLPPSPRSR